MADIFVRVDELATQAGSFAKLAGESRTAEGQLFSAFAQYAGAWGDDAPGVAFLAVYRPAASDTLGCVLQVPVQLTAISAAMRSTADAYMGTEAVNAKLGTGAMTA